MDYKTLIVALVSTFYIFGLCTFFSGRQILFSALVCLILITLCVLNRLKAGLCFALCIIFFLGFYNAKWQNKEYDSFSSISKANGAVLKGRIYTIVNKNARKKTAKFFMGVYSAEIYGKTFKPDDTKILVSIYDKNEKYNKALKIGDIIEVKGNLRNPKGPSNPSEFDYKKYLKNKGCFVILYSNGDYYPKGDAFRVISHPNIRQAGGKAKEIWWKSLQELDLYREKIIQKHAKYIKSPNLEVLGGIVFGDDAVNPPDEIKDCFINSGLLHLLAASGLNVALIFGIWWAFSKFIGLGHRARLAFGMLLVTVYTFMTGFGPSILRASIMLMLILAGKLMFKKADNLVLIFFTAFVMLLFNPKLINDVGFELSFLVTGGLITCIDPVCAKLISANDRYRKFLREKFKGRPKWLRSAFYLFSPVSLAAAVLVPLTAQLWAAPLQMYYFNTFTPYSVFANIAVLPFIGIISFVGFLSSLISTLPIIGGFVVQVSSFILNPLITVLLFVSEYFSTLPGSIVKTPSGSVFSIVTYYVLILLFVYAIKDNFKNKKVNIALFAAVLALSASLVRIPDSNLEILAYDVGNADNFLIKTPKNKYIMIDTGKLPYRGISTAKRITLENMYDRNIRTLETLIITHFDNDHSGGSIDIMENIDTRKVLIQKGTCDTANSCNILDYLKTNGVNYSIARDETVYEEENLEIKVFAPKVKGKDGHDNENSIITLVNYGGKYALFMGDGGIKTFKSLKGKLPGNITLLKAGHHGAKGVVDDEMLKYLKPGYSIISTGENQYGHPAPETIRLLENYGSKIFSTKDFGAIKFVLKDDDVKIFGFLKEKKFIEITPKPYSDLSLQIKL